VSVQLPKPDVACCHIKLRVVVEGDSVRRVCRTAVLADGGEYELVNVFGLADDNTCVVCLDQPASVVARPCGHRSLCRPCAGKVGVAGACPLCRAPIADFLKIET
jgi:hypothetical protein